MIYSNQCIHAVETVNALAPQWRVQRMLSRNQNQSDKKPKLMMAVIEIGIEVRSGKEPVVSSVKILQSSNKAAVHKMVNEFQALVDSNTKAHKSERPSSLTDAMDRTKTSSAHPNLADEFVDSLPQLTDADLLVPVDKNTMFRFLGDKGGKEAATEEKDIGGGGGGGGGGGE